MTFTVLRHTGQVFYTMFFKLGLSDVSMAGQELYNLGKKTTEINRHPHHMMLRVYAVSGIPNYCCLSNYVLLNI